MNVTTLKVNPDEVIIMKISPNNDSVEDAIHTYNNLCDAFPNNRIVSVFLENDLKIVKESEFNG